MLSVQLWCIVLIRYLPLSWQHALCRCWRFIDLALPTISTNVLFKLVTVKLETDNQEKTTDNRFYLKRTMLLQRTILC